MTKIIALFNQAGGVFQENSYEPNGKWWSDLRIVLFLTSSLPNYDNSKDSEDTNEH